MDVPVALADHCAVSLYYNTLLAVRAHNMLAAGCCKGQVGTTEEGQAIGTHR